MEDSVPIDDEIEWSLKRFRNHHSGAPSGVRAEHIKVWLAEARKEEATAAEATAVEGAVAVIRGPGGGGYGREEGYED